MIGSTIAKYRILSPLQDERGYVAEDVSLRQQVALALLPPERDLHPGLINELASSTGTSIAIGSSNGYRFVVTDLSGGEGFLESLHGLIRSARPELLFMDTLPSIRDGDPVFPRVTRESSRPTGLDQGQLLGSRYRIVSQLGRGGMAEVWEAYDLKLRVEVALKLLQPDRYDDDVFIEILRDEVRAARSVLSSNVCRIFDLVAEDGLEFVSMEYIDGTTLRSMIQQRGPLELGEAHAIAAQLLAGLEAIHEAGLVHRDIKSENIMVTRTGRVVIMDFGIASRMTEDGTMTYSGTPAYMAPEQMSSDRPDARADLFSAAIVLSELVAPGIRERSALEAFWHGVRDNPPRLPEGPWKNVLEATLSVDPAERPASASALRRALQKVTLRVDGAEGRRPYPGLAAFTEQDAEFFFGREAEVERVWKKLRSAQLLAVIGPSGAGKTSFLQAGLLPARPAGWHHVLLHPGAKPYVSLAEALTGGLTGDETALRDLARIEEPEIALSVCKRWRQRHAQTLLIVDQFEELFTLSPADVQAAFAQLLGAIALEADVHVLLTMRDDFLLHCHNHPSLTPITSELTLLGPPTGPALRRAIVQPALGCGYRFEHEAIVDELLEVVAGERGALPLLAFTTATLWDRRDREHGVLSDSAYQLIGGVSGALAQHAEETLDRIGTRSLPVVREIFRNLVTAHGTRATRTSHELLSLFEDKAQATQVLRQLIAARLLNSFDVSDGASSEQQTRIEIIHESLLKAWPRLQRWQLQDAEGAQLRDQLRQASQTWKDHGYGRDLLWTGTAYREYRLWRERYAGALSETEEAFARAMTRQTTQRRRRRQTTIAAVLVTLFGAMALFVSLWRDSEIAARHAEARTLRSLAQSEGDRNRSAAIAYAMKSLELEDTPTLRQFIVDVLWKGPTALVLPGDRHFNADFSLDGRWLAVGHLDDAIDIWPSSGGQPLKVPPGRRASQFGATSDIMLKTWGLDSDSLTAISVPDGHVVSRLPFDGLTISDLSANRRYLVSRTDPIAKSWTEVLGPSLFRVWSLASRPPRLLGERLIDTRAFYGALSTKLSALDDSGTWLAYAKGPAVEIVSVDSMGTASAREIGRHATVVVSMEFHPDGKHVASAADAGRVRIWSRDRHNAFRSWNLHAEGRISGPLRFDQSGRWLAAPDNTISGVIWDLNGPPAQDPLRLHALKGEQFMVLALHPEGRWVAAGSGNRMAIWPLHRSYPFVLRGHLDGLNSLAFGPDGEWIVSTSHDGTVRQWSLTSSSDYASRVIFESGNIPLRNIHVDPRGRYLFVAPWTHWHHLDLVTGEEKELKNSPRFFGHGPMAISHDGSSIALEVRAPDSNTTVRIEDLEGRVRASFDVGHSRRALNLKFLPDGRLLGFTDGEIRAWNPADGKQSVLFEKGKAGYFDVSADGRWLVSARPDSAFLFDMTTGASRELPELTMSAWSFPALDPSGRFAALADPNGTIKILPLHGGGAHLLPGHEGKVTDLAFDPKGRWLASAGSDHTIRLWPIPEGEPLHTMSREKLLRTLRGLTNMRAARAPGSETGYAIEYGEFPGWENSPTW